MTVLYVDNSFTFGGAINALAHVISEIDRSRFPPIVLSAQPPGFLEEHFPDTECLHWEVKLPWVDDRIHRRVVSLPGLGGGPLHWAWNKGRAIWWLAYDLPHALRLASLMRAHGVRLVHLNNGVDGMAAPLFAAKLLRLPVVAHARGWQTKTPIGRLYASMPDRWIAVSESVADDLARAGVTRSRIRVIHDSIDLSAFGDGFPAAELAAELGLPRSAPVFGIFGRIIPWKGIREFLIAAQRVMKALPDARALVVGDPSDGGGRYHREVLELARHLEIDDRVLFTGFRPDVPHVMHMCDVVVHASVLPEPFGMTVIEGMAAGKPVVAANSGGPTEIVLPGETGYLVDPADPVRLSEAIVRLLEDPDLAAEMGRKGAERARRHFSASRCAREVEEVYDRLIPDAKPAGGARGAADRRRSRVT